MDTLKYKGYEGTAEVDMSRMVCRGKILFISDLVTYEAKSPELLQKEFEEAVDDYLQTCEMLDRDPQAPMKGVFQVRVSPELHKLATLRAIRDDMKLNEVIVRALECYLSPSSHQHVNNTFHVYQQASEVAPLTATTQLTAWDNTVERTYAPATYLN